MAEVIPQINIDGTKIKNTWTEKEYVTDEVYNALNKAVIDLKNNNNLLDSNSILFREEYNSSSKNLNNAIHQGVYSFTNSAVNAPSGVTGGNLLVTNTSKTNQGSSIITQIAFCHNGAVYARTKNTSENFTAWNKLAYITDTVARATADKNGLEIDTTYVKNTGSNNMGGFFGLDTACGLGITSSHIGFFDSTKKTYVLRYNTGDNYVTAITPLTSDNSTKLATTAFVNNYAPSKTGVGASGTWGINITGNANTATKATQDGQGQQINTTYVKSVTASNSTITVTKGNGTNSTSTINNVSHATNADNATKAIQDGNGNTISSTYLKLSGGQMTGKYIIAPSNGILYLKTGSQSENGMGFWISNSSGNIGIQDYNSGQNRNLLTCTPGGLPNFSLGANAQTPSTSDNSTRVATTAFVHSLLGRAVGKTQPTLTALINWEAMKSANGGTDVRNIKNTSSGITAYGGDVGALNKGDIILKQAFTKFDALLIKYTHDDGWWNKTVIIPTWEFNIMFNTKGYFQLLKEQSQQWQVRGNACAEGRPSTTTRFNVREQNCGIIEIYGVTY